MIYYSQKDSRWANLNLPNSTLKMKDYGCLVACVAMVLQYYGKSETPASLLPKLSFIKGLLDCNSVTKLYSDIVFGNVDCENVPAPMDTIDSTLESGEPVVVKIDVSTAPGIQSHFVVLWAKNGNDYIFSDPYFDINAGSFIDYLNKKKLGTPAKAIVGIRFFHGPKPIDPKIQEAKDIVNNAYRYVLKRSGLAEITDPAGFNNYLTYILQRGWTKEQVWLDMLTSQEFSTQVVRKQ